MPPIILAIEDDVNGDDLNVNNLWANSIDANSITTRFLIDVNVIDMNVLNDANFWGGISVAKGAFFNTQNTVGDANFAHLGVSGLQFSEGGIVATGDSNFTNITADRVFGDVNFVGAGGNLTFDEGAGRVGIGTPVAAPDADVRVVIYPKTDNDQSSFAETFEIKGYDDKNASYLRLGIGNTGRANFRSNDTMQFRIGNTLIWNYNANSVSIKKQITSYGDFRFGSSAEWIIGRDAGGGVDDLYIGYDAVTRNPALNPNIHFHQDGVTTFPTGNVGIGTATPNTKLHIDSTGIGNEDLFTIENDYEATGLGPALKFIRAGSVLSRIRGIEESSWNGGLVFEVFNTDYGSIGRDGATTEAMRIDKDGNVGIGTTTPTQKLDVNGNTLIRGDLNVVGDFNVSNIAVSGVSFIDGGIIATGDSNFTNITADRVFGDVNFVGTGGNLTFDEGTGKVGIGTTVPTHKLNVLGDANITGDTLIEGDLNVLGTASIPATFMQASDVSDQSFAATETPYSIELDTIDENFGISRIEDGNILIRSTGVYYIAAQPQVTAAAGQSGAFHMWIQKDTGAGFADLSNSNVELSLGSQDEDVILLVALTSLTEGNKIRLRTSVSNTGITLDTQSPAGEPVIPSIIFSMYKIGT